MTSLLQNGYIIMSFLAPRRWTSVLSSRSNGFVGLPYVLPVLLLQEQWLFRRIRTRQSYQYGSGTLNHPGTSKPCCHLGHDVYFTPARVSGLRDILVSLSLLNWTSPDSHRPPPLKNRCSRRGHYCIKFYRRHNHRKFGCFTGYIYQESHWRRTPT